MIEHPDHAGRTAAGRFTRRALAQATPDDWNPDSELWHRRFEQDRLALERLVGRAGYRQWAEQTWPGTAIDGLTWRDIAGTVEAAIDLARLGKLDLAQDQDSTDGEDGAQ